MQTHLDQLYRTHTGKMLAYLVSLTNNLSLAEEIWHDTLATAVPLWREKPPEHPVAWLYKVARNKTIDRLRHQQMSLEKSRLIQALSVQDELDEPDEFDQANFGDEQLKLIFSCCHPALALDKQVPLTLNIICGLSTEQIADALVLNKTTLEQRLTRAKRKLKLAGIPFGIPDDALLPDRIHGVLKTIYLVFNAADNEQRGFKNKDSHVDLAHEAIRLVKHLDTLMPEQPEIMGLQALMLFHLARRPARFDDQDQLVLLKDQNRLLWQRPFIEQADQLLRQALSHKQPGSYQIQAAIQGVHCLANSAEQTDWLHIEALYSLLMTLDENPVIVLNAAVATSMSRGAAAGLQMLAQCEQQEELQNYSPLHAAKADMLLREGHKAQAKTQYQRAHDLTSKPAERAFYLKKMATL